MTRLLPFVFLLAAGCRSTSDARHEVAMLKAQADSLRATNFQLSEKQDGLNKSIENTIGRTRDLLQNEDVLNAEKAQKGVHYVLRVSIRQVSYSFSISKQLRDAVNEEEFDLPTDKTTYEHAKVGDDLFDSFRAGSAFFRGSLGSWRLKIVGKKVQIDN